MAVTGQGDAPLRSIWFTSLGEGNSQVLYPYIGPGNAGNQSPLHTVMRDFFFEAAAPPPVSTNRWLALLGVGR